jgi:acyl carrier protein
VSAPLFENREQILAQVRELLVELFEIDAARITPEANLYKDLEIDSIDAIDLIDRIKRITGKKVAPEDFKSVRTVGDVVDAVERLAHD